MSAQMNLRALLLLTAITSVTACAGAAKENIGGAGGSSVRCSSDYQCGDGACMQGNCLNRVSIPPTWAAEISPPGGSTAAVTEVTTLNASGLISLTADPSIDIDVSFNGASSSALPAAANVVLSIPSTIAGRPDRTFESGFLKDTAGNTVTFAVPGSVLAAAATIDLNPVSPADQESPPFSFAVGSLEKTVSLTVPADNVWIRGVLHTAVNDVPARGFAARAYQDGRLVSSVSLIAPSGATGADGSFRIAIPTAVASNPVTVQLSPQGTQPSDPAFTSDPWSSANPDMGVITLPAYQVPQLFALGVYGQGHQPIPNAVIQTSTTLTPQVGGTTRFAQGGLTDVSGGPASLRLIPGTAGVARTYDVAVVPAAGSPFATFCTTASVINGGTIDAPAPLSLLEVPLRPIMMGNVVNASGAPVANALVTATRDAATAHVCSATGPTTVNTTTSQTGAFTLALDPGAYQIDYDPPPGSLSPRLTEYNIGINGTTTHLVQLPAPNVVEGDVTYATKPLPNATVRFYERRCTQLSPCMSAPVLRLETQADANGHFRAVVAMPAATN